MSDAVENYTIARKCAKASHIGLTELQFWKLLHCGVFRSDARVREWERQQ